MAVMATVYSVNDWGYKEEGYQYFYNHMPCALKIQREILLEEIIIKSHVINAEQIIM